jgi:NTE family protein
MSDDIVPLLKVHEYFRGVSDEAVQDVMRHTQVSHHAAGGVVHEADVVLTTVNFVLRGRLCLSVTVDLVGGKSVVRECGDAVHAILESINLPVLSVPIVRNGQALIDGGLVNNIPADVLVSMGCNFVIAVSVTAKMETVFCDISAEKPSPRAARPGIVPTILRSLLVQNHNLNAFGVQPADVVIEPDVTDFDLTEFMRAKELAAIGEAAAVEQIPKIRQLLNRLDPQLFPPAV